MNLAIPVLFIMVLVLGAVIASRQAQPHDIYRNWHPPGNAQTSCCNGDDCRPTTAYMHDDGLWRAWNGTIWLVVPPERVLPTDHAGDGRTHLCEKANFVYCFTAGQPRS